MMDLIKKFLSIACIVMVTSFGCSEDELGFSLKPAIGFESTQGTILESNATGIRVGLYTNATINEPVTVTIELNNFQNLVYGDDFTTEPALVDNTLTLTIDPEDEQPSFFVYPTFNGKERILNFKLTDVEGEVSLGQQISLSYFLTIKSLGCPTGVEPVTVSHNFDVCSDFATPTGFIEAFEPGSKTDRGWGCRASGLNSTRAVRASAFGGSAGEDKAWLIMNPVRVAAGSQVTIHFWVYSAFAGPGVINVKWSSDYTGSGNPLVATWTDLPTINSQFPAADSDVWTEVQGSFTDICAENVYLALQFSGATNTASSSWDIEDLTFKVE